MNNQHVIARGPSGCPGIEGKLSGTGYLYRIKIAGVYLAIATVGTVVLAINTIGRN